ncbi:MAG: hypothetical protein ACJAYH_002392 [Celeribacter sp.]|jgi:hypothetical protein
MYQHKTGPIPNDDFKAVSPFGSEYKNRAIKRIKVEFVDNNGRQSIPFRKSTGEFAT